MDDAVGIDDVVGMGGGGRDAEGGGSVEVLVDGVCIGGSGVLLGEGDVEDAVEEISGCPNCPRRAFAQAHVVSNPTAQAST